MVTYREAIAQIRAQIEDIRAMESRLLDAGKPLPSFEAGRLSAYRSAMQWLDASYLKYIDAA